MKFTLRIRRFLTAGLAATVLCALPLNDGCAATFQFRNSARSGAGYPLTYADGSKIDAGDFMTLVAIPDPSPISFHDLLERGYFIDTKSIGGFTTPGFVVEQFTVFPTPMQVIDVPLYVIFHDSADVFNNTVSVLVATGLSFSGDDLPIGESLTYDFDDPRDARAEGPVSGMGGDGLTLPVYTLDAFPSIGYLAVSLPGGARWREVGSSWWEVSASSNPEVEGEFFPVEAGQREIEFLGVPGYITPQPVSVAIVEDHSQTFVAPFVPDQSWEGWVARSFPPRQREDPEFTAPDRDPDSDGLANILERAFNLDPTRHGRLLYEPSGLPEAVPSNSVADSRLVIEYLRIKDPAAAEDFAYVVEFSQDGASWSESGTVIATESLGDDWERLSVEAPSGGARMFGRVRVESARP